MMVKPGKRMQVVTGCFVVLSTGVVLAAGPAPQTGPWRAWLDSPGGELPFEVQIERSEDGWGATIVNGEEQIDVPRVTWDEDTFTLDIDYYDSKITAKVSAEGARLDGEWKKRGRKDKWTRMAFHATAGEARRFAPENPTVTRTVAVPVFERWAAHFSESNEQAVALFKQKPGDDKITGTFLTNGGDYRYLAGNVDRTRVRLSSFDGAHALLFDARVSMDGTLRGDFWSKDTWHETWEARRDPDASLPDPFTLPGNPSVAPLAELAFPNVDGKSRSLGEEAFAGPVRIIEIFGSWCPNCHDATTYLVELDQRYRSRGLKIVALAFELTGDFARDAAQVKKYGERHGVKYPILIAGVAEKEQVAKALPFLGPLRAYPTTLFLDGAGRVRAVHTGFSGPATDEEYDNLRVKFERVIESLLASSPTEEP